jgi:Cu/Zn superoxide dismutase
VTLTINDDTLTINADVTGLSPAMHMIHIHGFTVGAKAAACASAAQDKDVTPDPRG